tara:strand:+ start:410 stop:646 length:237 start_codon:yes stop_codon:yes gene_type:complete
MNFIIYTRNGCPYCSKIKQVLEAKNLVYVEKKLDRDFTREDYYQQFGKGTTFPQVLMDGRRLGGCTESVRYLRENNIL